MRYIEQFDLFYNSKILDFGAFDDLTALFEHLDDEEIIFKLEKIRGKHGRNDWPVSGMWRAFIASRYYNHRSIRALISELSRNPRLMLVCGLHPRVRYVEGKRKICRVPTEAAFSRFMGNLLKCKEELQKIFEANGQLFYNTLSDFGKNLMTDGKALQSCAHRNSKNENSGRRGEHDGNHCKKNYVMETDKGEKVVLSKSWFGFRMHVIADARYQIPVYFSLLKANDSEQKEFANQIEFLNKQRKAWIERCEYMIADKGYDSTKIIERLESLGIRPVIDICNKWKDGEKTKQYKDTQLVYDYKGNVFYYAGSETPVDLKFRGYEARTNCHRYGYKEDGKWKDFRINRSANTRIFTRVARGSKTWQKLYKQRSGIERINGQLDRDFGFENHYIRGKNKMEVFVLTSFIVMQTKFKIKLSSPPQNILKKAA